MLISVLIFAYNRKEFILEALNSTINQTLGRDNYEVILITNLHEDNILKFVSENGIRLIEDNGTIGNYIVIGLKEANGDIITFLDDDDVYEVTRLESVFNIFNNNPNLFYYRNSVTVIDKNGLLMSFKGRRDHCHSGFYSIKKILQKGISSLQWNSSSIAIRKSVIEPYVCFLRDINAGPDVWIYFLGLLKGQPLYLDCRKMTRYRIHGFQLTKESGNSNHLIKGYYVTLPLKSIVKDKWISIELEKTRVRSLVLSSAMGTSLGFRVLFSSLLFYFENLRPNIRDLSVILFIMLEIFLRVSFKYNYTKAIFKLMILIGQFAAIS